MKTSELTGSALCYVVTMLEMPHLKWGKTIGIHHASNQIVVPELPEPQCYTPFMSWAMIGPIIEREGITIVRCDDDYGRDEQGYCNNIPIPVWAASTGQHSLCKGYDEAEPSLSQYESDLTLGPTPLVAAMRCFVASKLGPEVEVPDEIAQAKRGSRALVV